MVAVNVCYMIGVIEQKYIYLSFRKLKSMKNISLTCYKVFLFIVIFASSCSNNSDEDIQRIYVIRNNEFGIHNDKTHAQETTEGINRAIEQAKAEGYNVVKLTKGDYLIHCIGESDWYPVNGIFIPTNMTVDLTDARLHVEPNNSRHYALIQIDHVENATVIGGHLIGDRAQHDASHIQGYGIQVIASNNVTIKDVTIEGMTGDGIIFTTYIYMHFYGRFPSKNVLVTGCDISDCGRQGIHVIQAKGIDISDNNFHDILGSSSQYAIDINPNGAWHSVVDDVRIHDNRFENCTNGSMRLWNGSNIEVYNNHMENQGLFCVSPERVGIHNNTFTGNGSIYIGDGSVDICVPTESSYKNECSKVTDFSTKTADFSCP